MKNLTVTINLILFLPLLALNSCTTSENYQTTRTITLKGDWEFSMKGDSLWLPATVPGTVHTDLLANDKIPQPFYRDNEKSLQWIDKKDWLYRCIFTVDTLGAGQVLIRFKGLDTYAEVTLNGSSILQADNMFRTWIVDVTGKIEPGRNELEILFRSPVTMGLEKLEGLGYALPAVNDQSENGELGNKKISVFTRKAPYHYGWDWGPRFVTSGIWRDIELSFIDHAQIENVYYKQTSIDSKIAGIDAEVSLNVVAEGDYLLTIISGDGAGQYASTKIFLEAGANSVTLPFLIPQPDLWWPNGMGEQHLYAFKTILSNSSFIIDTLTTRVGLRSIRLVQESDSLGKSFYFEVNGSPLFAKGANYIPNDNFLPRVTAEKYEQLIASAAGSNMNMLRVWGGGIYENDIFYDLCDRYGLLIWQDFMFACSMYPGDDEFLESVYREATDHIIRLRNHASIALWCGNNEIDAAWCEGDMNCGWGWKNRYSPLQRKTIWKAYDTLFHRILPDLVKTYDGLRSYWPSSPQADWGEHASYSGTSGDMHYWGVWHGQEPFSEFYNVTGRFMSEYGFQSFPDFNSVKKFTLPHDWDSESDVMRAHQRSGAGNTRIVEYMSALYPVPADFSDLLYMGQVLQAEGIKQAIHAHRSKKPYCMGTLYWQLNDCWPAASWSGIDYYGFWKALQYYVKKAYAPVILTFVPREQEVLISVCSDDPGIRDARMEYAIRDFSGKILEMFNTSILVDPTKSIVVAKVRKDSISLKYDTKQIFLEATLRAENEILARDLYFFEDPKALHLPVPKIISKLIVEKEKLIVELVSDKLARNVYIDADKCESRFSDNYFDLLPGEVIRVECKLNRDHDLKTEDVNIKTLNELLPYNHGNKTSK